jgi:hypothetical protein
MPARFWNGSVAISFLPGFSIASRAMGGEGILPASPGILPGEPETIRSILDLGSSRQDAGKGGQDARATLRHRKTGNWKRGSDPTGCGTSHRQIPSMHELPR